MDENLDSEDCEISPSHGLFHVSLVIVSSLASRVLCLIPGPGTPQPSFEPLCQPSHGRCYSRPEVQATKTMATTTHEARNFPKLNGKNFSNWQPYMLVLLEQKGRLNKIISKTDVEPLPVFNLKFFSFSFLLLPVC